MLHVARLRDQDHVDPLAKHVLVPVDVGDRVAHAISIEPEVILFDEPCAALDPIATQKIEELMQELKHSYTQLIVTHNMQQAARASDFTAFMYLGEMVEFEETAKLFVKPSQKQTEDYISGRFG